MRACRAKARSSISKIPTSLGEPDRESLAKVDGTKSVLLIDDDETFRYVLRQIVGNESRYEFMEADGGEQGIKLAREKHPDVIILDLQMPTVDGFTVLQQLCGGRTDQRHPRRRIDLYDDRSGIEVPPARTCPPDFEERHFPGERFVVPARCRARQLAMSTDSENHCPECGRP